MSTLTKTNRSMYDHYYTAVDVTVDLFCSITNKRVNIDKTVAIAYTHNISSVPVYLLGSAVPGFFSVGNSLIQGQLDIAFKDTSYLKATIDYLTSDGKTVSNISTTNTSTLSEVAKMSNDQLRSVVDSKNNANIVSSTKSFISVPYLLDIIITFNNANSNMVGGSSTMTLEGVKFISQSSTVHSQDDNALVDRFTFYARNIQ